MSPAKPSKQSPKTSVASSARLPEMPSAPEWGILLAIELLVVVMVRSAGSRRGLELMPWPDGLEYAASAVNLAHGRGAVLHFGGYTYPSRYTGGYPLILEFFCHGAVSQVPTWSGALGMMSVFAIFVLAVWAFGRAAGAIAAL